MRFRLYTHTHTPLHETQCCASDAEASQTDACFLLCSINATFIAACVVTTMLFGASEADHRDTDRVDSAANRCFIKTF